MTSMNRYYTHSGTAPPLGILLTLMIGLVAVLIAGTIYGYAVFYIPFIYVKFLITLGYGAVVGLAVFHGAKAGKIRNSSLVLVVGLIVGLFAEYTAWVIWIFAASKQELLLLFPWDLLSAINLLNEEGAWSIFGSTPTGLVLWAVWVIEAVMIVGAVTLVSWSSVSSLPFCERCSQWVEDKEAIAPCVFLTNPDDFKKQLDLGNYSVFGTLKPAKGAKDYTEILLLNCRICRQMPMVGVKLVTTNRDKNGKESTSKKDVVENLVADPATHEIIRKASIATESAP